MQNHRNLKVWVLAIDFCTKIYSELKSFPKEELFGLTSQIKRSAVSIPSNIAEGAGRNSQAEFKRFINIAIGSVAELETQLIIAKNVNFINEISSEKLLKELVVIQKMLHTLAKKLKS